MPQQMLDLGGEVEGDGGTLRVQSAGHRQGLARPVEEIRIAEGDVGGARGDLLADVREDRVPGNGEEAATVDGRNRAVAAAMKAAAARLDVAHHFPPARSLEPRVLLERRQRATARPRQRLASKVRPRGRPRRGDSGHTGLLARGQRIAQIGQRLLARHRRRCRCRGPGGTPRSGSRRDRRSRCGTKGSRRGRARPPSPRRGAPCASAPRWPRGARGQPSRGRRAPPTHPAWPAHSRAPRGRRPARRCRAADAPARSTRSAGCPRPLSWSPHRTPAVEPRRSARSLAWGRGLMVPLEGHAHHRQFGHARRSGPGARCTPRSATPRHPLPDRQAGMGFVARSGCSRCLSRLPR